MVALANFILRGRLQALLVTGVAAVLMLFVPLVGVIAGGALALVVLRNGLREGLVVAVGAAALLAMAGRLIGAGAGSSVGLALAISWLPVLVAASVLRASRSQASALAAAGLLIGILAVLFHVVVGDPLQWWEVILGEAAGPLIERLPVSGIERDELVAMMARGMTGMLAATFLAGSMASLMFGRWLQSLAFNPGGFGAEFRELHLGRAMSALSLVIVLTSTFLAGWIGSLALTLLFLCAAMLALQGMSLIHAVVRRRGAHIGWLFALYGAIMIFPPQAMVVLAAAGFADGWLNIRARNRTGGPPARSS